MFFFFNWGKQTLVCRREAGSDSVQVVGVEFECLSGLLQRLIFSQVDEIS